MPGTALTFVHSSDEHYGADRILLDIYEALPPTLRPDCEFWLPTDVTHGTSPLCVELEARGATVRHVDLPVLRRAYRTPRALLKLALRMRSFRRRLERDQPQLVYCTTSAAFLMATAAKRAGVPTVVGHVQEFWSRNDERVLGRLARSCDRLIAISGAVRDALPPGLAERTVVVSNATREPARVVPLTTHDGELVYVVASRWNGWKGHRSLLAAFEKLTVPARLVVLGGPPTSGESVDVPALVSDLTHPERVDVIGEVADIEAHIEAADVVVMPSESPEPFGLIAIEAFARGRPVVATDAGGLTEIVTHGVDGWLYPPGDAEALAGLLDSLTREEVTRAGQAARETYEARFAMDRYAEEWNAVLSLNEIRDRT